MKRLCSGCRSLDGEHDFGPTCTAVGEVTQCLQCAAPMDDASQSICDACDDEQTDREPLTDITGCDV